MQALLVNGLVPNDAVEQLALAMMHLLHDDGLADGAADTLIEVVHYPHLARYVSA